MFNLLRGFLPWILYAIFYGSSARQFYIAIVISLISALALNWQDLKKGFILSWVTLIYFIYLIFVTYFFNVTWLRMNASLISNLILAVTAFGSYFIKKPFTAQYAKQLVPKSSWSNPLFIQINNIITIVWGSIFLITAFINYSYAEQSHTSITYILLTNIGWILGIYFSKNFPGFWKKCKQGALS